MTQLADMNLFVHTVASGSLSAAGRQLGFSPALASKRLARLEARLGVRLLQRTSRRLQLTEEGVFYFERCQAILNAIDEAEDFLGQGRNTPRGSLHISAPVALGKRWLGPALAIFARRYPDLKIHLSLSDAFVDVVDSGIDCAIRIGNLQDSRLVVRKLADNYRVICAAPLYLDTHGVPQIPEDLTCHQAIHLSTVPTGFAQWSLTCTNDRAKNQKVDVPVRLSTDNGEQAHAWALAGLGLVRRSWWDVAEAVKQKLLVQVLPDWQSDHAPLQLVFASRHFLPARTRLLIDFLVEYFAAQEAEIRG